MSGELDLIAEAHAALGAALDKLRADSAPRAPPISAAMGQLGRTAIASTARLGDADLARLRLALELALDSDDGAVKDAAATGFLEAAMAATARRPEGARVLRALGPRANAYCRDHDMLAATRTPGVWD